MYQLHRIILHFVGLQDTINVLSINNVNNNNNNRYNFYFILNNCVLNRNQVLGILYVGVGACVFVFLCLCMCILRTKVCKFHDRIFSVSFRCVII
jgi:hypothetical protein